MKKLFGSLIIVGPFSNHVFKFRFTPTAIATLVGVWLLSFSMMVAFGHSYAPVAVGLNHGELESENRELKVSNLNEEIGMTQIEVRISVLEEQAEKIGELLEQE